MERRNFVRNTALGFTSFLVFPRLVASNNTASSTYAQLIPIHENPGQIRHGLLQLPQLDTPTPVLSFDWLKDVSRNVFFKNGFGASMGKEDMEITSILLENKDHNWADAIQIQQKQEATVILTQEREWQCKHHQNEIILLQNNRHQAINFSFGNLNHSARHLYSPSGKREVFIYLLAGIIKVNGRLLEENVGLGLQTGDAVVFEAVRKSQFVLMEKPFSRPY